jgi:hypothetical protein
MAAGMVGAGPAVLPAFAGACASCLGAGSAVAAGAAGAVGVSWGGVALGLAVLVVVAAVQLGRLRRSCPAGPERRRRSRVRLATLTGSAVVSFAAVQWVLVPLLSSTGGGSPGGQLP